MRNIQIFNHCFKMCWLKFSRLIALLVLLLPNLVLAEGDRPLNANIQNNLDAILVLDASGSMLVTDPEKLRDEGAKLFIQSLKPGDRLGIVAFSGEAKIIRPLSDYNPSQADEINRDLINIGSVGEYTDILAGVKLAASLLDSNSRPSARPTIILLSDGKMDVDPKVGTASIQTHELLSNLAPELKAKEIKIYTLAFSPEVDKELLAQLSAATEGESWYTPSSEKVHESYANLFLALKKPQIVPLTSRGFRIDEDIDEATFYINLQDGAQELKLVSPSGKAIQPGVQGEGIHWFKSQKFDVVTITTPEVGDWQLIGLPSSESFATVLTDLRLVTDWPASINADSPVMLQARLYDDDRPVVLPEMTDQINYAFQITPTDKVSEPIIRESLVDDGSSGDKISRDGIYSFKVNISEPGEYKLRIVARAPTFERNQQIPFRVKPRMISLSVERDEHEPDLSSHAQEHTDSEKHAEHDKPATERGSSGNKVFGTASDRFKIVLSPDAVALKQIQIKLLAIDEKRRRLVLPVTRTSEGSVYVASVSSLAKDGEYQVQATLTGEAKRKGEVEEKSQLLNFTKVKVDLATEEVRVVTETKPEEPPSAWPYVGLVTFLNLLAGGACLYFMSQMQSGATLAIPEFGASAEIDQILAGLETKAGLTEIDLSDPLLTSTDDPPIRPKNSASPVSGENQTESEATEKVEEAVNDEADTDAAEDKGAEPPGDESEEE